MIFYSYDSEGIYHFHADAESPVPIKAEDSNPAYQAMQAWRETNQLVIYDYPLSIPDLTKYKLQALNSLIAMGDAFVESLTSDLLACELQAFDSLVAQAEAFKRGETGRAIRQITIQSTMTSKTLDEVADSVLRLDATMNVVVPVMSSLRQNLNAMLAGCTTVLQVDLVVAQAKAGGKVVIQQMMAQASLV